MHCWFNTDCIGWDGAIYVLLAPGFIETAANGFHVLRLNFVCKKGVHCLLLCCDKEVNVFLGTAANLAIQLLVLHLKLVDEAHGLFS